MAAPDLSTISTIPFEIGNFFQKLYGIDPEVSKNRRNTIYSVSSKEISIIIDPFKGCHINVKGLSDVIVFKAKDAISELSEFLKANQTFNSIWIDVAQPTTVSTLFSITPDAFVTGTEEKGDLIYDYQQKKIKIWQWLNPNEKCSIPAGATHNIGATALIIDKVANKVLLIEEVGGEGEWSLPGGVMIPSKIRPLGIQLFVKHKKKGDLY